MIFKLTIRFSSAAFSFLISFCFSFIIDSRALSAVSIKFIILFSSEVDATNVVDGELDVDDELDVEAKLDVDDELDVDAELDVAGKLDVDEVELDLDEQLLFKLGKEVSLFLELLLLFLLLFKIFFFGGS